MEINKKSKLILSIIGVSAIVIPAILLIFMASKAPKAVPANSAPREIDRKSIEEKVKNAPKQEITFPSPIVATPPAGPVRQGSPSAR